MRADAVKQRAFAWGMFSAQNLLSSDALLNGAVNAEGQCADQMAEVRCHAGCWQCAVLDLRRDVGCSQYERRPLQPCGHVIIAWHAEGMACKLCIVSALVALYPARTARGRRGHVQGRCRAGTAAPRGASLVTPRIIPARTAAPLMLLPCVQKE